MPILYAALGVVLIFVVLWDGFETVILPRRVTRRVRLARIFFRAAWKIWTSAADRVCSRKRHEAMLSYFGPLSLFLLLAMWAAGLIFGFSLVYLSIGLHPSFEQNLFFSGSVFFPLGGMGDIPAGMAGKSLAIVEAALGFGFLAILISYFPPLNESFARREVRISLMDARAGSPATAAELLRRHYGQYGMEELRQLFADWEIWSAELLESHLSYPALAYFRSQHDNQSWLSSLTTILDGTTLVMAGLEGACERQARLTFAITRHAIVDLAQVLSAPPIEPEHDRLPGPELIKLRALLLEAGHRLGEGPDYEAKLGELRDMYEPYVNALSKRLRLPLPSWIPADGGVDNWQTSKWEVV
jgi:hypothetical protein